MNLAERRATGKLVVTPMTATTTTDPFGLRSLDVEATPRASPGPSGRHERRRILGVGRRHGLPGRAGDHRGAAGGHRRERVRVPELGRPVRQVARRTAVRAAHGRALRLGTRSRACARHDRRHPGRPQPVFHLSSPGDGVVLHMPAYHPFLDTIGEMDRRLVAVDVVDGEFDYDDLERRLARPTARIWILCHPHNPLGRVFERPELERIAEIAARLDIVVISDEIHADLTMPGHAHIPFESLGPEVSAAPSRSPRRRRRSTSPVCAGRSCTPATRAMHDALAGAARPLSRCAEPDGA